MVVPAPPLIGDVVHALRRPLVPGAAAPRRRPLRSSLAQAASAAAPTAVGPVYDAEGRLVETPFAPSAVAPRLSEDRAVDVFLAHPKVADWLDRYPPRPQTDATFDRPTRTWTVHVWSGEAGEVATGVVSDATGAVTEAWTGPQVAWKMARGRPGAFGGKLLTSWPVWLGFSALFLLGLVDLRRPLTTRTLDLLVLLSFGVSLAFFNRGEVLQSAALAMPPLLYLTHAHRVDRLPLRARGPADAFPAGRSGRSRRRRSSSSGSGSG